jgi:L-amino acid N-acyltransferase YncA
VSAALPGSRRTPPAGIRGIGTVLLHEIMSVAQEVGLTQLAGELYEDQTALRKVFSRYGFREEGRIPVYQRVILMRDLTEDVAAVGRASARRRRADTARIGWRIG